MITHLICLLSFFVITITDVITESFTSTMIRSNSAVTGSEATMTPGLETVLGRKIDELHLMKTSFSTFAFSKRLRAFVWIQARVDQLRSAEAVVGTKEKILCAIGWMVG
jgi:hypothetical protein